MARIEIDVRDRRVVDVDVPLPPNLFDQFADREFIAEVNIWLHFPGARPKKVTVPGHYFDPMGRGIGEAP